MYRILLFISAFSALTFAGCDGKIKDCSVNYSAQSTKSASALKTGEKSRTTAKEIYSTYQREGVHNHTVSHYQKIVNTSSAFEDYISGATIIKAEAKRSVGAGGISGGDVVTMKLRNGAIKKFFTKPVFSATKPDIFASVMHEDMLPFFMDSGEYGLIIPNTSYRRYFDENIGAYATIMFVEDVDQPGYRDCKPALFESAWGTRYSARGIPLYLPYLPSCSRNSVILSQEILSILDLHYGNSRICYSHDNIARALSFDFFVVVNNRGKPWNHTGHPLKRKMSNFEEATREDLDSELIDISSAHQKLTFNNLMCNRVCSEFLPNLMYDVDRSLLYLMLQQGAPALSSSVDKTFSGGNDGLSGKLTKTAVYKEHDKYNIFVSNLEVARKKMAENYLKTIRTAIKELKIEKGNQTRSVAITIDSKIEILEKLITNHMDYENYISDTIKSVGQNYRNENVQSKREMYVNGLAMINNHYKKFIESTSIPWYETANKHSTIWKEYYKLNEGGSFEKYNNISNEIGEKYDLYTLMHYHMFPQAQNIPNNIKMEIMERMEKIRY